MDSSKMYFENLIKLFHEDLATHSLLNSFEGKPDLFYADLYFYIIGDEPSESDIKIGLSLELISLSFRIHFGKGNMSSLDLIMGDYFYARALKRTVETGEIDAVKILSRAVSREAALQSSGFYSEIFPSLVTAACELGASRGKTHDEVKRLLKKYLEKKLNNFWGRESTEGVKRVLHEWGWFD